MKKIPFALVPVLVLCVLAFASCGAKETASTTVASTTAAYTAAEGTTAHVHTPAAEYTVDEEATCAGAGSKSYHCTVCGEIIEDTVVVIDPLPHTPDPTVTIMQEATCVATGLKGYYCLVCGETIDETVEVIPVDPNAHKVAEWSATPTLLNQTVHATGECTVCRQTVEADRTFAPAVYNSKEAASAFSVAKSSGEIRGSKHFYPTEDDLDGNDLWFEYSFLWNPTYANWSGLAELEVAGLWDAAKNSYSFHRPLFYCYMRDNVKSYCPYAGHFDYTTQMPGIGKDCILDPGNGQPIYTGALNGIATEESSPAFGEYGWHRVGVHYHQEVAEYSAEKGGVVYAGYHELFIDGVKVWVITTNMQGNWNNGTWNTNSNKDLKSRDSLLWTAEYDGANWTYTENDVLVKMYMDASLRSGSEPVYVVIDDPIWTCGDGFALNVEPIENPTETTVTLAEGVVVPGTIYFKVAD